MSFNILGDTNGIGKNNAKEGLKQKLTFAKENRHTT
jgi:hypothetical protein